jgi:hypothetical protein
VPECDAADFTLRTVPRRFAELGDVGAGIDGAAGSLEPLLELAARQRAAGLGDAPWPPHYAKGSDEPPRVEPSRVRVNLQHVPEPERPPPEPPDPDFDQSKWDPRE